MPKVKYSDKAVGKYPKHTDNTSMNEYTSKARSLQIELNTTENAQRCMKKKTK